MSGSKAKPDPKPDPASEGDKLKLQFHRRLVTPDGVVFDKGEVIELTAEEAIKAGLEKRHTESHCAVLGGEFPDVEDE